MELFEGVTFIYHVVREGSLFVQLCCVYLALWIIKPWPALVSCLCRYTCTSAKTLHLGLSGLKWRWKRRLDPFVRMPSSGCVTVQWSGCLAPITDAAVWCCEVVSRKLLRACNVRDADVTDASSVLRLVLSR